MKDNIEVCLFDQLPDQIGADSLVLKRGKEIQIVNIQFSVFNMRTDISGTFVFLQNPAVFADIHGNVLSCPLQSPGAVHV